jgi:glucosamine--fructose-6-phosphate aminotransferase (isomerizing)
MTNPTPGALMAAEIAEQPAALQRLLDDGATAIAEARERITRHAPRFALFAARGTSDHAALYAKYLTEIQLGMPAGLASPSTLTVYGSRPDLREVLFVAVSQSGSSPDMVDSVTAACECGALTVAVTNDTASPLAHAADITIDVHAGPERAVAATKTYTTELLALRLLLVGSSGAAALPAAASETLESAAGTGAAQRYRFADRLITTARGYSYPTAREAALKLMETSYVSAQAFSAADLLHGPLAMIDSGVPAIAVMSPGRGGDAMSGALDRLAATGADVLRVGPSGDVPIAVGDVPEDLLPVLEILPLQQLAWRLALDRGADPDRPRGLAKATSTW